MPYSAAPTFNSASAFFFLTVNCLRSFVRGQAAWIKPRTSSTVLGGGSVLISPVSKCVQVFCEKPSSPSQPSIHFSASSAIGLSQVVAATASFAVATKCLGEAEPCLEKVHLLRSWSQTGLPSPSGSGGKSTEPSDDAVEGLEDTGDNVPVR